MTKEIASKKHVFFNDSFIELQNKKNYKFVKDFLEKGKMGWGDYAKLDRLNSKHFKTLTISRVGKNINGKFLYFVDESTELGFYANELKPVK